MNKQIVDKNYGRTDVFEVVDKWPFGGYKVWNIGRGNFPHEGYIPLAQESWESKYYVRTDTLKALYLGDEQLCLKVMSVARQHWVYEDEFNKIVKEYGQEA